MEGRVAEHIELSSCVVALTISDLTNVSARLSLLSKLSIQSGKHPADTCATYNL